LKQTNPNGQTGSRSASYYPLTQGLSISYYAFLSMYIELWGRRLDLVRGFFFCYSGDNSRSRNNRCNKKEC